MSEFSSEIKSFLTFNIIFMCIKSVFLQLFIKFHSDILFSNHLLIQIKRLTCFTVRFQQSYLLGDSFDINNIFQSNSNILRLTFPLFAHQTCRQLTSFKPRLKYFQTYKQPPSMERKIFTFRPDNPIAIKIIVTRRSRTITETICAVLPAALFHYLT